jgi:hypothetical protein
MLIFFAKYNFIIYFYDIKNIKQMKKTLLIALLLIPFFGFSQTQTIKPIEGFLGIKFGSNKADVTAAVKAKGGVLSPENSTATMLAFLNVPLGTRSASYLCIFFVNDKVFEATFFFKADVDDHTINYYDNLVNDINGVYGTGNSVKTFSSTFKDGDGYEITAIQEGDADYTTKWVSDKNSIAAKITVKLLVTLNYVDHTLYAEYDAQEKAKNKSDY